MCVSVCGGGSIAISRERRGDAHHKRGEEEGRTINRGKAAGSCASLVILLLSLVLSESSICCRDRGRRNADTRKRQRRMSQERQAANEMVEDGCFCFEQESVFTVSKTSHFFAGDGFNVYDSKGEVVFRVDNYGGADTRDRDEVVLMDAQGKCILTVRKKRPSLHHRWEGFEGERKDGQKPSFSVRRSSIIGTGSSNTSVTVEVYASDANSISAEYQIEGSYPQRSCTVYDSNSRETLAEVRRKKVSDEVVLGKDVFCLCVKAGFDSAFAMGMVLVLDQIYGDQPATTLYDAPAITPTQQQLPLETS